MLHRPILTQLCAHAAEPAGNNGNGAGAGAGDVGHLETTAGPLYTSFAVECAKICLGAAMDLIDLVHTTYKTDTTGGWWWDGLYAFTGGLAVTIAHLSPPPLAAALHLQYGEGVEKQQQQLRLDRAWVLCQDVLVYLASYSISAQKSLKLLQRVHADVVSRVSGKSGHAVKTATKCSFIGSGHGLRRSIFFSLPSSLPHTFHAFFCS